MKYLRICQVFILLAAVAALAIRISFLDNRPMHGDEAVHAIKFGELLEKNIYRYDSREYHGPTLNYFTLIPALLRGEHNLTQVDEFTLRIVPVVFGTAIVLLFLLISDGLGIKAAVISAVLTVLSPAFVFYSRYYIQEMLFIFFTFALVVCGWRYSQSKNIGWIILAGTSAGLMYATKETCLIAFAAMLMALWLSLRFSKNTTGINYLHIVSGILAAAIVSIVFYSSFFTNPAGVWDSVLAFKTYFHRAQSDIHIHPWYYYLKMLLYSQYFNGPVWSEAFIVLFAVVGFIFTIKKKDTNPLTRFIAFYTVIMVIVYSVIPYKTPWSMLGFLHGFILLAGFGISGIIDMCRKIAGKIIIYLVLIAGCLHLVWQAYQASYIYYADVVNPYVYAQPTKDVVTLAKKIEAVSIASAQGKQMLIQVACNGSDYWPLPWYLRGYPNVGWHNSIDETFTPAPVVIVSSNLTEQAIASIYKHSVPGQRELYVPILDKRVMLRPDVELTAMATKELKDKCEK